jgi:hypothetical protein
VLPARFGIDGDETLTDMCRLLSLYTEARGQRYQPGDGSAGVHDTQRHPWPVAGAAHGKGLAVSLRCPCIATELIVPFFAVDLPLGDRYNLYYAMMQRFAIKALDADACACLAAARGRGAH